MAGYDPKSYWNEKAKGADGDPLLAACGKNPHENRCMYSAQKRALDLAIGAIGGEHALKSAAVLDFGCGSGRWVDYFQNLGADYRGIDISDEMISLCKSRYPDLLFKELDGLSIPFESDELDLVVSIAVLHHNRPKDQDVLLSEITRVLRPGGHLFLFEELGSAHRERVFPRPAHDWIETVEGLGYECVWHQSYAYFLITDTMNSIARKLNVPFFYRWRPGFLLKADAMLSPRLSEHLSFGSHGRGAMLFRRSL